MPDIEEAKNKALRYISYRSRTEKEVVDKLKSLNYDEEIITQVINEIKRYGYIDDYKFTQGYIRDRVSLGGYGMYKIRIELKSKGISGRMIDQAYLEEAPDEVGAAVSLLEKKLRGGLIEDKAEMKKLSDYLLRRGFSYDLVQKALKSFI